MAGGIRIISNSLYGALAVHTEDLDNDGDIDVVAGSQTSDRIYFYLNNGGGGFSNGNLVSDNADELKSLFAADLNGDGEIDIISASKSDNKIAWYHNLHVTPSDDDEACSCN